MLTLAGARRLVTQYVDRVHATVLLEHLPEIVLVHGARHLTHEHLDVVGIGLLLLVLSVTAVVVYVVLRRRVQQVVVAGRVVVVVHRQRTAKKEGN